jgi:hypothetical protein
MQGGGSNKKEVVRERREKETESVRWDTKRNDRQEGEAAEPL